MSYQELQKKLEAAEGEVAMAEAAHREAALLATETGSASATTKLDKATTALKAARQSVIDLTAAVEAGAQREAAKVAAAAKAEADAQNVVIAAAVAEVRQAADAWDLALDGLVAASRTLLDAATRLDILRSGQQSLMRARDMALNIIMWRIRFWTGDRTPMIREHELKISAHLTV